MAKGDIKLSKKHGLQPCIPKCLYCGEEKNQIVLLGAAGDKLAKDLGYVDGEMPMSTWLPGDFEPCEGCMDKGAICVAVIDEDQSVVGAGYAKEDDIKETLKEHEDILNNILKRRVMLVESSLADVLGIEIRKVPR